MSKSAFDKMIPGGSYIVKLSRETLLFVIEEKKEGFLLTLNQIIHGNTGGGWWTEEFLNIEVANVRRTIRSRHE